MIEFVDVVERESARFGEIGAGAHLDIAVPSCPGWDLADLTWHLAEVQYFWASIVEELLVDPGAVPELARPAAADLAGLSRDQATRLVDALRAGDPDAECWSWHADGHSVGWVRRRQAHEALIHRVDAELAVGELSPIDPELAADGVDEILNVMLDASDLPAWASFEPTGRTAAVETTDGRSWAMELGWFRGTSPNTGTAYDDAALRLDRRVGNPDVVLRGDASDLDLWLWGRGSLDPIQTHGDAAIAAMIRQAAAAGTQ